MKRLFLLLAIFGSFFTASAQIGGGPSITGRISGTVIDSITKKPLDYATVAISRSGGKAIINGVVTDEKGNFKLNNIAPGKYKITISFIGYPNKVIDPVETSNSKPDNNMGTIIVAPSARALAAVNVVGQQSIIENKIDKIVYNAEKDITAQGGNATDVLRKVPLLAVDINGNVSLRGDQNVRVLINGKPSGAMSNNLADVLRSFPADQIKSVEVVTSPSAKYDAEGSGGIINIITKSKNVSGVSGGISGGLGTRQNNGNANISIKENRLTVSGNFGGNFTWPQNTPTNSTQINLLSGDTTLQNSLSKVKRYAYTGSGEVSYDFNSYNAIHSSIRFNQGGFKTNGETQSRSFGNTGNRGFNTNTDNQTTFGGFDWIADYTHKFKKEGHELTLSGQWSHSKTTVDYTTLYSAQVVSTFPNQEANNGGTNNEYTAQLDYALPISKSVKFEAGGKSISRIIGSNYDFFNNGTFNSALSNDYDYNQYVSAGYSLFTFTLPKNWSLQTGVRLENTKIDGKSTSVNSGLKPFENSYTSFVPSFSIAKTIKSTTTLKLSYSKRIQRPSLQFLNPFLNQANPLYQSQGNPMLAPEVAQTVELNMNTYIKSSVVNVSVYYKNTAAIIESLANPIDVTVGGVTQKGTLTSYANIGKNNSLGASFFGSVNPIKPLTLRGSINGFTYSPTADAAYASQQSATGTYFMYNVFASGSLALKGGLAAETFAILNSPRRTIQGKNPAFGFIGFGVRKELMNKRASLGFNTLSPFQNAINFNQELTSTSLKQSSRTAFPFRSFGVTFSYNFGKLSVKPENPMQQKKSGLNDDLKSDGGQGSPR